MDCICTYVVFLSAAAVFVPVAAWPGTATSKRKGYAYPDPENEFRELALCHGIGQLVTGLDFEVASVTVSESESCPTIPRSVLVEHYDEYALRVIL